MAPALSAPIVGALPKGLLFLYNPTVITQARAYGTSRDQPGRAGTANADKVPEHADMRVTVKAEGHLENR